MGTSQNPQTASVFSLSTDVEQDNPRADKLEKLCNEAMRWTIFFFCFRQLLKQCSFFGLIWNKTELLHTKELSLFLDQYIPCNEMDNLIWILFKIKEEVCNIPTSALFHKLSY